MPNLQTSVSPANYDSRWFIWTIVFLVVTGISLVSYIVLSDDGTTTAAAVANIKMVPHKTEVPVVKK